MSGLLDTAARLASPWAYIILGLLAAAESAAFVGLAVPGETAMLLGGFLAYQGRVSLAVMMAAGALGAVVGDQVGYQIGRVFGEPLKRSRLGRRVGQERWAKGEAYLRAMPYRTFLPWNAAGGAIWAPGFVLLGYLAGGSWRRVERLAGRASLLVLILVLVVGAVVVAARWVARHPDRVRAAVDRQLQRPLIARLRERYQRQLTFLAGRLRPGGALGLSLTVTILALAGAAWAFGAVLQDILARDELALVDRPVMTFLVAHREAWLTTAMRAITDLGGAAVLIPVVVVVGLGWRWRSGSWRALVLLAGAWVGARVLQESVKLLVARPRPPAAFAIVHAGGLGFPSGHATDSAATYGMLAALLAVATSHWPRKVAIWAVAAGLAGMVSLSRVYLGVHWLTDALGGLALGAAWLFGLLTTVHAVEQLHASRTPPPAAPQTTIPSDP